MAIGWLNAVFASTSGRPRHDRQCSSAQGGRASVPTDGSGNGIPEQLLLRVHRHGERPDETTEPGAHRHATKAGPAAHASARQGQARLSEGQCGALKVVPPSVRQRGAARASSAAPNRGVASHTFTVPSSLAEAMRLPSGLNATLSTQPVCPLRVSASNPIRASHTFTVLSSLPDTMRVPSAENATLVTPPVCPLMVSSSCPVCASHTFTVWSQLPEAIRLPSAENATLWTVLVCPWRVRTCCPVWTSHTLTSPKYCIVFGSSRPLPETMRLPSAENATVKTGPVCPLRVRSNLPVRASHTFIV